MNRRTERRFHPKGHSCLWQLTPDAPSEAAHPCCLIMTQNLNRSKIKTWGSAVTDATNFAVKQDNFYVAFPGQRQDRRWVHEADSVHRRLRALHDLSRQPRVGIVGASPFPFLFFFKGPACRTYWLVWFQMATRWKPVSKAGVAVVDFFLDSVNMTGLILGS